MTEAEIYSMYRHEINTVTELCHLMISYSVSELSDSLRSDQGDLIIKLNSLGHTS